MNPFHQAAAENGNQDVKSKFLCLLSFYKPLNFYKTSFK